MSTENTAKSALSTGRRGKVTAAAAFFVMLMSAYGTGASAAEEDRTIMEGVEGQGVDLLDKMHGTAVCKMAHGTAVHLLTHLRHARHRFAKIEVIEGDCAGMVGVVWAASLTGMSDDS